MNQFQSILLTVTKLSQTQVLSAFAEEVKPEKVTVIEGAGHFDLYWRPEHVEKISDEVAEFFHGHMRSA